MELQPLNSSQLEADTSSTVDTVEAAPRKRKRKKMEIVEEITINEELSEPETKIVEVDPSLPSRPKSHYAEIRSLPRQNRFPKRGQKAAKILRP